MKRTFTFTISFFLLLFPSITHTQQVDYDEEIRTIAQYPAIKKAFQVVLKLESRSEQDLIELTQIPAPPFKEEKRAARYAELLQEAGQVSVSIDDVGNVIAQRTGTRGMRVIALAAHLDTVFPEGTNVKVRREGNQLLAPGIGDDTRGLVLVLTVLRAMNAANVKTRDDVLFVGTVGEEGLGDLRGVKHLFREDSPRIDAFIAVDGGSSERVLNHAIGSYRYKISFNGPGGHSWSDFGLGNPAHALARTIYFFDEEANKYVTAGPRTSYNIGRIGGGTSVNSIPFENWFEVDMRSTDPERLDGIDAILHRSVARAMKEQNEQWQGSEELTVNIKMVGDRPSGTVNVKTPLIQRALAATRFLGGEPQLSTGSTDANIPISLGIPATTIGRGGKGGGSHSLQEWWSNIDGHEAIQKALLILVATAGTPESN